MIPCHDCFDIERIEKTNKRRDSHWKNDDLGENSIVFIHFTRIISYNRNVWLFVVFVVYADGNELYTCYCEWTPQCRCLWSNLNNAQCLHFKWTVKCGTGCWRCNIRCRARMSVADALAICAADASDDRLSAKLKRIFERLVFSRLLSASASIELEPEYLRVLWSVRNCDLFPFIQKQL